MERMGAMGRRGVRVNADLGDMVNHVVQHKDIVEGAAAVHNTLPHLPNFLGAVADAGDAAATAVEEAAKPGPFGLLVNGIKGAILGISNQLQAAGVEQSIGLSIVIFTLFVKALTFPLTTQQIKSQETMQLIQPKIKEIQEKYKDDPNKSASKLQAIYSENKVNPAAGLFPAFAQIPIFIALYRALQQLATADMMNQPFLWLPNLEGPTYGQIGSAWLANNQFTTEETLAYLSLPIILIASQVVSQRLLTTKEQYDAQPSWTKFLPIIFGYFSVNVPSGLAIYWVTNNLVTTGTNFALKAKYKNDPEIVGLKERLAKVDAPVEKQMPYVKPKKKVVEEEVDTTPAVSSRGKDAPAKKKKKGKKGKKSRKATA